ncbi:lipopolysaccharide biosynthesis protein [Muriicola marianensis]|uniref:Oligosaccharide flippase family protein n=1 Tax=Muriicola marianensis TaxID=1324801 RepID=A0ABQ1QXC7_9FLAO|nr:MATE family efflux transporter [Muriicola marianensis]GGD49841.1 hypothetical protein GCM10011361_15670 [Muriicola marianensis]
MKYFEDRKSRLHVRSLNFLKQLKRSFLYKVLSVGLSFILVRFLLKYLDVEDYGLWAVVLSFLHWIVFFDLGIANGVKNKLSEALSMGDERLARKYLSTGYFALLGFSVVIYLLVYVCSDLIPWESVLNSDKYGRDYLETLVLIVLFFTLANFVLSLINTVFHAVQKASLAVLNQFSFQVMALLVVVLLITFTNSDLHLLALGYGMSMVLANLGLSLWFYWKNNFLRPSFKLYDKELLRPILSLGLRFFFLQTTMMVILMTDRFILLQLTSPEEVTRYDVIYRFFNLLLVLHTLINAPLWAIYTEAYEKKDFVWIEKTMRNLTGLSGVYILVLGAMVLSGDIAIRIWLGKGDLGLTTGNYLFMALLIWFSIVHSILAYFTNGISKTNLQLATSLIGAIINIPLSILFVNTFSMGLNGVILATIISLSLFCFTGPFQVIQVIRSMKVQSKSTS